MGTGQFIVAVQLSEVGGRVGRDKVGLELRGGAVEGAADDLLDLAGVEVDAGAETRHVL